MELSHNPPPDQMCVKFEVREFVTETKRQPGIDARAAKASIQAVVHKQFQG